MKMHYYSRLFLGVITLLITLVGQSQEITQNIKGQILDQDSKSPLIGATVVVVGSDPILGSITNLDGSFKVADVPIGRVTLKVTFIGYKDKIIPNLLINSSQEFMIDIAMEESFLTLAEVAIIAKKDKSEVLNEMVVVSARSFSVEETKRFAGSLNDPARLASAFAGVVNSAEGNNDIIVRGNSSKGVLWRLEGIEIPNPNHFANEGATGGPINALSSNMLSDSDFMSGAFSPEYGNALSGVFDMRLKRGNYDRREYTVGLSTLGTDLAMEGPLSANNGSYIANYRYSTLDMLDKAGVVDFGGVPRYQDLTYNIYLPLNERHFLSFFGLGGISSISSTEQNEETDENIYRDEFGADMGTTGLIHNYLITENTYLKSFVSLSGTRLKGFSDLPTTGDNEEFYRVFDADYRKTYIRTGSTYGHKFNSRNKLELGFVYNRINYKVNQDSWDFETEQMRTELNDKGATDRIQAFTSWKFRIAKDLTMVSGAHLNGLTLNNSFNFEPRLALRWDASDRTTLSFGGGLHSKMESPSVYLWRLQDAGGSQKQPNKDLQLSKSAHLVLGFDRKLGHNTHIKTEIYYQHLYDSPVENDPNGTYSLVNASEGYNPRSLENEGTGRNYGVELTMEQYLHKSFYYLASASIFNSLYTPKDGIERKTAYASDYILNFLGGKEFSMGKQEKNRIFFVNTKLTLIGGQRYTPIDLAASIEAGEEVRVENRPFSAKSENVFIPNLSIGTRRNKPTSTHEFKIDIQNVSNNLAVVQQYYVQQTEEIEESSQLGLLPTISYTISF